MQLTDAERLILTMLCEIHEHLKIDKGIDPKFVQEAIATDNTWGLIREYDGIFHGHHETPEHVEEVVSILEMWRTIEFGFGQLTPEAQATVRTEAELFGDPRFKGFDGNNESEQLGVAHFLVDHMNRFDELKGRELNSHCPTIDAYRRMLKVYMPMKTSITPLTAAELITILKAQLYPR